MRSRLRTCVQGVEAIPGLSLVVINPRAEETADTVLGNIGSCGESGTSAGKGRQVGPDLLRE